MSILSAENLIKRYGGRTVVKGASFHVGDREIVGLLGRNGAGKTTTFRMAMGMITPDGGSVTFQGHNVSRLPMYKRARLGMGYLSQNRSVFQKLTVEQNIMAILETRPLSKADRKARCEELMEQFDLAKLRTQSAHTLSGGESRKLEIARALVTEPSLLLLDEPFAALDPIIVQDLQKQILELRDKHGIAMLITDHSVERTLEVCDRAYIISEGDVMREGTPKELVNDAEVRDVYLGDTFKGGEFD
ncbi:MAG: LPS export ABC transporter ATP-binding protein [Phycisphaera sp.]|nr:LPS export ABC transporter ATP-binding protein [Phycisphaera sp.]